MQLVRAAQAGDRRATAKLIQTALRHVLSVATRYQTGTVELEDLVSEGNLGLLRALKDFDPDSGKRFVTYSLWWVRAYVIRYFIRQGSLAMGAPISSRIMFRLQRTWRDAQFRCGGRAGEALSMTAEALGLSLEQTTALVLQIEAVSVDLEASQVADTLTTPEDLYAEAQSIADGREYLAAALSRLDPRERYTIEAHTMADKPETFVSIGRKFGVQAERARQLHARALKKLRADKRLRAALAAA